MKHPFMLLCILASAGRLFIGVVLAVLAMIAEVLMVPGVMVVVVVLMVGVAEDM